MKEAGSFRLTPIHPFTPRQGELLQHLAQGKTRQDAANTMHISPNTVRNLLCGYGHSSPGQLGVLGIIEQTTGTRPKQGHVLRQLVNDVLLKA